VTPEGIRSPAVVARLLAETEDLWANAWENLHAPPCCAGEVLDPAPPRLEQRAAGAK